MGLDLGGGSVIALRSIPAFVFTTLVATAGMERSNDGSFGPKQFWKRSNLRVSGSFRPKQRST